MIICPECKKELSDGVQICDGCGAKLPETEQKQFTYITLPKKAITIIGVCVAVFVFFVFILPSFLGVGEGVSLFIKDNKLYVVDFDSLETYMISDSVVDGEEVSNVTFSTADVGEILGACLSSDGQTLFYLADFVEVNDGCGHNATLYMRSVKDPDKAPAKIDTEVRGFSLSPDGKLLTYNKGDHHEMTLWRYDFKKKEMIVPGKHYKISADKRIVFYTAGGSLYVDEYGEGKREIDQGANIYFSRYDDDTVVYQKEREIYKYTLGGKAEKVAEGVENLLRVYKDSAMYYCKNSGEVGKGYALYYYDGKKEIKIADRFKDTAYVDGSHEYPYIFFTGGEDKYIAVREKVTKLKSSQIYGHTASKDGKTVCFVGKDAEDAPYKVGTLYSLNGEGEPIVLDTNVYGEIAWVGEKCVYMKNVSGRNGVMYIDKEIIDADAYPESIKAIGENGDFLYYADYDKENLSVTLKVYSGGKITEIAQKVGHSMLLKDGKILYLCDYDREDHSGDFYVWADGKSQKLAADVCSIIPAV